VGELPCPGLADVSMVVVAIEWTNLDGQGSANEARVVAKGRNAPA